MKVEITRKQITKPFTKNGKTEKGTLGKLRVYINDKLYMFTHPQTKKQQDFLYTMENEKEGAESGKDLRIPASNRYYMVWSSTGKGFIPQKYKGKGENGLNKTILICDRDNPNFASRRILVHVGNSAIDTLGCVLLGWNRDEYTIVESTIATQLFYDVMSEHDIKDFTLEIKNEIEDKFV